MPTAGKLAGAILFGLLGWYVAGVSAPLFPDNTAPDFLIPAGASIGVLLGWRMCGARAGEGYSTAFGLGLTFAVVHLTALAFVVGFARVMKNGMRGWYKGPMDALLDIFGQMAKVGLYFIDVPLLTSLAICAVICAFATEYFGRRYP